MIRRRDWLYFVGWMATTSCSGGGVLAVSNRLRLPDLRDVVESAGRLGRPVLVIVIPRDSRAARDDGVAIGTFLTQADEPTLARLALTEFVCVAIDDVEAMQPQYQSDLGADPGLVLIGPECDERGRHRVAVLPRFRKRFEPWEDLLTDSNLDTLSAEDRQRAFERRLEDTQNRIRQQIERRNADLADFLLRHVPNEPPRAVNGGEDSIPELAERARARYVRQRPPGALWSRYGVAGHGCSRLLHEGIRPEIDEDTSGLMCGMAHAPEGATRFLTFLTANNVDAFR